MGWREAQDTRGRWAAERRGLRGREAARPACAEKAFTARAGEP
jgi:hypothetical protein